MEAGQRVQPNLSRNTVASVIRTFHRETGKLTTQYIETEACCTYQYCLL